MIDFDISRYVLWNIFGKFFTIIVIVHVAFHYKE